MGAVSHTMIATGYCPNGMPQIPVNITTLTVERQLALGRGQCTALRWIGPRRNRQDFTYDHLAKLTNRTARVLLDAGIQQGDVIAVLLPKTPEMFWVALAAWKIGAVFCPLLTIFGPAPITARLNLARAKILITTPTLYTQSVEPYVDELHHLTSILYFNDALIHASPDLTTLVDQADPSPIPSAATHADSPAFLHFTSGTTGLPKGTLHGHGAALAHLQSVRHLFDLKTDDMYWCTAEPGWVPFTAYGIIAPLAVGCVTLLDSQEFNATRWYSILVEDHVTIWYTTPDSIGMMMRLGAALARSYNKIALRIAASGGGPLHSEAVTWGKQAFGITFINSWWQSETGAILIANCNEMPKPGSLGRPLPGVEIAVVTQTPNGLVPVTGQTKVGELAIKRNLPSMFIGYVGEEDRYRKCFTDEWYLTGDFVRRDRDGFLWFAGRGDDLIEYRGHCIGPFDLENALLYHPAIAEAAVIGRTDLLAGQCPIAYVTLNPGFEAGTALHQELFEFINRQLGNASPHEIYVIEQIPKTPTGSIMHRSLRQSSEQQ